MNPELIEKIESYIHGEIEYDALAAYARENQIENLEEKIDWVKSIPLAFELEDVRAQIKAIADTDAKEETPVISLNSRKWRLGIAASVLLVAIVLWLNRDTADINSSFGFQDPGIPVVMSETENYPLYDALTYFGEGDYDTAISKLESLNDRTSDTVRYYLGASYYYNDENEKALPFLQEIADEQSSVFSERAEWLLIMHAVQENRNTEALQMLDQIKQNSDHLFYDRANALSKELNQEK